MSHGHCMNSSTSCTSSLKKNKNKKETENTTVKAIITATATSSSSINRPRNYLIQDATKPYIFTTQLFPSPQYLPINKARDITLYIHQSSNEDTWPGGALWDIGLLLAKLFVSIYNHNRSGFLSSSSSSSSFTKTLITTAQNGPNPNSKKKSKQARTVREIECPRWMIPPPFDLTHTFTKCLAIDPHTPRTITTEDQLVSTFTFPTCYTWWKNAIVLELGCGVGLTGLAFSAIFQNQLTLLTDLPLVIDHVTKENIRLNESILSSCASIHKKRNGSTATTTSSSSSTTTMAPKVHALPLCWGNLDDALSCSQYIQKHVSTTTVHMSKTHLISTASSSSSSSSSTSTSTIQQPHLIIIGDVAYQHKPGAPCHFDALLQTVLYFVGDETIILFGTRIRMPASMDLLQMFQSTFREVLLPPIEAHELDSAFHPNNLHGKNHNITIHVFKKKE